MKPRLIHRLSLACVALFWMACIAIPLFAVFSHGGISASGLLDPIVLSIARLTAYQALVSALISGMLGLPLGLWVGSRVARGDGWARAAQTILAVPFSIPTVVVAAAGILWLGNSGVLASFGISLDWAYSLRAVILAHVFLNAPWIALQVAQSRAQLPGARLEAAQSLGAGRWACFRFVTWPFIREATLSSGVQVFSLCAMSFALVLLLGGGPPVETLETSIYAAIRYGSLELSQASACAFWQLVIASLPWAIHLLRSRNTGRVSDGSVPRPRAVNGRKPGVEAFAGLLVCVLPLLPFVPLIGGVHWSEWFRSDTAGTIYGPLRVSIEIAVSSAVASVAIAVFGLLATRGYPAWGRILRFVLLLPAGISLLVLGLGFWFAYARWVDPFDGSWLAIIALQTAAFFPLAYRTLFPVMEHGQRSQVEAACTLGASRWRAFRLIEWPRWRAPLVTAFAVVAGASIGEVAALSLFFAEGIAPLPLGLARLMSQYRFAEAQGLAAVLLIVAAGLTIWVSIWGNVMTGKRDIRSGQR